MKQIRINVSKPYDVVLGDGLIDRAAELIRPVCRSDRLAVVTDDVVDKLYGEGVRSGLEAAGFTVFKYVFPNGEGSKNIGTLSGILEFLAEKELRRNDALIALGGGVVGDMAGFAAAVYMRGIPVIQIPTTLLSSIGGKTAIDLAHGKNLAGAFWQPSLVIADTRVIGSLPAAIFAEGMGEVVKCNVIRAMPTIERIEQGTLMENLPAVVEDCVTLKQDIVQQDEFDRKKIRNILNAGHTVAHAIEKLSGYAVSHGRAVGTGLVIEAEIARKLGMCDAQTVERVKNAVSAYGLYHRPPYSPADMARAMHSDKKNTDADIVFELPRAIGDCVEVKLSEEEVARLLAPQARKGELI